MEGALQRGEDRHPHLRRVAVTREIDEARHEAPELVAAHEQAEPAPIAEAHHAEREHGEAIGREPEHLVARDRLQHVDQRAPPVAQRRVAGAGDHRLRLPAHDGERVGGLAVDGGGVQPEEALLAHDRAVGVEPFHAHEVEGHGPVHRRTLEHLRQREHRGLRRPDREGPTACVGGPCRAESPPASSQAPMNVKWSSASHSRNVAASATSPGSAVGGGVARRSAASSSARSRIGGPVVDDGVHVGEHRLDGSGERVEDRGVALAVDLGVHQQRAVHHRMQQQVHLVPVAREQRVDAVDDERQVVGDDQDDGVR